MKQQKQQTISVGTTQYTDLKEQTHTVTHSVIFTDAEKRELEEKIAEDLYQIFTHKHV